MASGRTLRAIVGAAAALLLVVAIYLVARPEETGDSSSPSMVARAADPAPAPAELPAAPVGSARPIDAGDASHGGEPGPTSGVAPPAAAPVALADIGQPVTLSGRVVDERGAPIAAAEVIHVASPAVVKALGRKRIPFGPDLPWDDFARTRTDAQGGFALRTHELPRPERDARPPLQDGAYVSHVEPVPSLAVLHPDFEATLYVCRGFRAGDYDAGEIALRPGGTLAGRLVDSRGAAVAGGAVGASELRDLDDARWDEWNVVREVLATHSGEDGRFTLGSLWAGDLQCTFEAAGFVPLDKRFTVPAGPTDGGLIVLDRGGTITGRVLDAQGAPVAGATVKGRASQVDMVQGASDTAAWELEIIVRADNARDSETVSGPAGEFELLALNQEKYTLLAGLAGYEPAKLSDVAVGTSGATLTLRPSATVVVSVLDARTREPVAGASATGRRMSSESTGHIDHTTKLQVLTGEDALALATAGAAEGEVPRTAAGLIVATGLGTGLGSVRNTLTVSAAGYATLELELPAVAPSGRVLHVVELPREASIAGRVVDARGAGVGGASIEVVESKPVTAPRGWDKPRTETADAEGRFRVGALRAGEWKLTASAEGFARADPAAVTVEAEQALDGVTLPLAAAARITGVLLASSGAPLSGGSVQAQRTSAPPSGPIVEVTAHGTNYRRDPTAPGRNYTATSEPSGRFAIDGLPAGSYEVTAGPGVKTKVELSAGAEVELELRQRQPPTIRGRVTDVAGPVAGATVTCHIRSEPDAWNEGGRATTDAAGEYQLQLAQAGECVLVAEQGDERATPRRATTAWDTPVLLDLAFGGERLSGRVLDAATGAPLDGATIRFSNPAQCERDGLSPRLAHLYSSSVRCSDQGRFETRRLEPGRYTIEVSKKAYASTAREGVEVPAAGDAELRFELLPGAIVTGTVRAAGGGELVGEWKVRVRVDPRADGGPAFERLVSLPPDRRFERRDLPAGHCLLQALRFVPANAVGGGDPWAVAAEESRDVASGETTTVDIVVAP